MKANPVLVIMESTGACVMPPCFKSGHKKKTLGIVEYAGWSVRQFLTCRLAEGLA